MRCPPWPLRLLLASERMIRLADEIVSGHDGLVLSFDSSPVLLTHQTGSVF